MARQGKIGMTKPRFDNLLYDVEDGIATVTLNRPDRLNAMTGPMMQELLAALDATDTDDEVKAVVVTGAGRGFCAGADLSRTADTFDYAARDGGRGTVNGVYPDGGGKLTLRIFDSLKPVIAAVNGPAVGIGVTMLLAMDIRIASDAARFGFVFARRGMAPEAASSWFLPRIVGISRALDWCYSGRVFPAAEAKEGGLVRSVHPAEDLLPAARAIARDIIDNSAPVSVTLVRQLMWRGLTANHPMEAHQADSRAITFRGRSADAREGIGAFFDKRPPHYPDRVSSDLPDIWPHWRQPEFK
jgi:enoyl-CoA hydratase/carnithine racemase